MWTEGGGVEGSVLGDLGPGGHGHETIKQSLVKPLVHCRSGTRSSLMTNQLYVPSPPCKTVADLGPGRQQAAVRLAWPHARGHRASLPPCRVPSRHLLSG